MVRFPRLGVPHPVGNGDSHAYLLTQRVIPLLRSVLPDMQVLTSLSCRHYVFSGLSDLWVGGVVASVWECSLNGCGTPH